MSRTDKTRPYNVQLHDVLLPSGEHHDHCNGSCEFEGLEEWQHRFNDSTHRVHGGRYLSYTCTQVLREDVFRKTFTPDPARQEERERRKRAARYSASRQCRLARWHDDDFGDQITDELTRPQPRKWQSPCDQHPKRGKIRKHKRRKSTATQQNWLANRQQRLATERAQRFASLLWHDPWNINWSEWPDKAIKSPHGYKAKTL